MILLYFRVIFRALIKITTPKIPITMAGNTVKDVALLALVNPIMAKDSFKTDINDMNIPYESDIARIDRIYDIFLINLLSVRI